MQKKAYVKPSKAAAFIQVIVACLFLPFGVFLCLAAEGEARPFAMIFMIIWIIACAAILVYGLIVLLGKSSPAVAEIGIENFTVKEPSGDFDFETKLRKLESLRKEGLINEAEYKRKRSEIMNRKW